MKSIARSWLVAALSSGIGLACAGLLVTPSAAGQHPSSPSDHTLRSLTEVVNVPVAVRDKNQRLIPDLKREDFNLTEDGLAQEIKYFSRTVDVPLTLGLVVDTTVCQDEGLPLEKEAAQNFIRQVMQPSDQGFVMRFGASVEFLQHLTGDVALLTGAIDKLQIEPHPTAMPRARPRGRIERGPHHLYDAIAQASNELMKSPAGRKVLILLSDGFEQDSRTSQKAALDAATRADAIIYCINVVDPVLDLVPALTAAGRPVLAKLADQTGGRLFRVKPPHEAPAAFDQIAAELRSQYFLGYTPSNRRHDGSFRRIRVWVSNQNYSARARPGYYAPLD